MTEEMHIARPFGRPLYVMLKPAGARCNMACSYCYYLEKGGGLLSDALLEEFTRQYMEAQTMPQVLFTWHGGEPLLRPLAFYEKALALQRRYAHGRQIDNCLQTNGTLLTDEWCRFLRDNHFLVGISIDGPQALHDAHRLMVGGKPSWQQVMRGIDLLEKHGVQWNVMATVNAANVEHPIAFYRFFRDIGCRYLQFTPVVERRDASGRLVTGMHREATLTSWSVTPRQWGAFLCAVYDEWVQRDVGTLFVQLFDATLANWAGQPPGICALSPTCSGGAVMDADGTVYSCDHFVFPAYRLGNIRQQSLTAMLNGEQQQRFVFQKSAALTPQCHACNFRFTCHGECPRNRFAVDSHGNPGHNYLCQGYQQFFAHVAADMDFMLDELRAGRSPANVMARHTASKD